MEPGRSRPSRFRRSPSRAVRSGDWKLIVEGRNSFVFDVRRDLAERQDLTSARPEVARRLRALLDA